jgi:hypothetical protein
LKRRTHKNIGDYDLFKTLSVLINASDTSDS